MPDIYLRNGMVLQISQEHSWKLVEIFFLCEPDRMIKLPNYPAFKMSDIIRDKDELRKVKQINLDLKVDPKPLQGKRMNNNKSRELA